MHSPTQSPATSSIELNNGVEIPTLGLGVYQSGPGAETQQAVRFALDAGYRHIDTASAYGNEKDVGVAISSSRIARHDLFITTKLWNSDHGYEATLRAFDKSRIELGLDYIDLYLIHWPVPGLRMESWRAMEELLDRGLCRAIGVSNYTIRHLDEHLSTSAVAPAVNQVEFSPFLYQKQLLDYCRERNIQIEAYSPLTQGKKLKHRVVKEISRKYGRTPAQILIRWAIEHRLVVIPKSVHRERIEENAQVFDFAISSQDMARLDSLDEGFRTCWDPTHES
ncbi:MAG TPA: aldo/keto reductase [Blastocatellia bacterium]|jgi:diketogulonate reductase-like aldo/keto reductase